jgi:hypothetical protein
MVSGGLKEEQPLLHGGRRGRVQDRGGCSDDFFPLMLFIIVVILHWQEDE